ncbi:acyl-CoA N-acyltransferase [Kockovaella imperatae]|uniref:Acyl-CoA N-acyltransferase n=1 Tax=Kockovaella imperatae TaxID=4999 RepID=A0A1Y1U665_9TREE|nr:acyl-CoA N-acyltransferase [Kockovaella imperatae]ORX33518.1 acyl-CoA N-acyltransferase [Kockovaella imperatae]
MSILTLNEGLAVRQFKQGDAEALVKYLNDSEVLHNLTNRIPQPYTQAAAEWWVNHCIDKSSWLESGPWPTRENAESAPLHHVITLNDQVIGSIALEMQDDVYCRTATLGYWLARPYWGQGIMTRVAGPYVEWAFATFGRIWRIEASVFDGNEGSVRVLERAGFKFEGRKRGSVWKHGKIRDDLIHGIVRDKELA